MRINYCFYLVKQPQLTFYKQFRGLTSYFCLCRKRSIWCSSYHVIGTGPEEISWDQSASYTAEGEHTSHIVWHLRHHYYQYVQLCYYSLIP